MLIDQLNTHVQYWFDENFSRNFYCVPPISILGHCAFNIFRSLNFDLLMDHLLVYFFTIFELVFCATLLCQNLWIIFHKISHCNSKDDSFITYSKFSDAGIQDISTSISINLRIQKKSQWFDRKVWGWWWWKWQTSRSTRS